MKAVIPLSKVMVVFSDARSALFSLAHFLTASESHEDSNLGGTNEFSHDDEVDQSHRCGRSRLAIRFVSMSPNSETHKGDSSFRSKIWPALFCLSYQLARAQQLRAGVSRQRLSDDERARLSYHARSVLFPRDDSNYSSVASRKRGQAACEQQHKRRARSHWYVDNCRVRSLRSRHVVRRDAVQKHQLQCAAFLGFVC